MELSNPCMQSRYIMKELGYAETTMYEINNAMFALTFLLCRNILGLPVVYWTVCCDTTPLIVKAGGLGILLVSWFWTTKLIAMIQRALGGSKRKDKRKSA